MQDTEDILRDFVAFASGRADTHVCSRTVLDWIRNRHSSPRRKYVRLRTVILLSRYLHSEDELHDIPPQEAFGRHTPQRRPPFLFTPADVEALVRAARTLAPERSLQGGIDVNALARVVLTHAGDLKTQEGIERERKKQQDAVAAKADAEMRAAVAKSDLVFRRYISEYLAKVRTFQDPSAPLHHWGDPSEMKGLASPRMVYLFKAEHDITLGITLQFEPPVKAPRRLGAVKMWLYPGPSEAAIRSCFGRPLRVSPADDGVRRLEYDTKDSSGLGVVHVDLGPRSRVDFFFEGRPPR